MVSGANGKRAKLTGHGAEWMWHLRYPGACRAGAPVLEEEQQTRPKLCWRTLAREGRGVCLGFLRGLGSRGTWKKRAESPEGTKWDTCSWQERVQEKSAKPGVALARIQSKADLCGVSTLRYSGPFSAHPRDFCSFSQLRQIKALICLSQSRWTMGSSMRGCIFVGCSELLQ